MRKGPLALLAVCVTAATLSGCGGPPRDGYVAVGAAAPGPERGAGETVAPQGVVEYQSLGGPAPGGASARSSSTSPSAPGYPPPGGSGAGGAVPGAPAGSASAPGSPSAGATSGTPGTNPPPSPPGGSSGGSGGTGGSGGSTGGSGGSSGGSGGSGTPPPPASSTPPPPVATPARIQTGAPARSAAADRWCERVGVTFANTGGTAARSGTVTFSTHIIGALGVDWATITSAQPLPAPIAGGSATTQTYTVCVESWRVPLGMHIETQRVTATWS
ncbi:hypothetical protein [Streptomyces sp. G-G2]|uniref:hypothetical protein n=1 Tax=Streptomyces sp. G-G2 TaxID=3046201 RepID=UPI0024BA7768|nr:hypothetical protein [Streptomyces sp. G-G2]MDJ0384023.1 hypothetical protein [Streptomyces sp. G-G2]